MKNTIFPCLLLLFSAFACKQSGGEKTAAVSQAQTDSVAVAETLHGFFAWYNAQGDALMSDFTDEVGGHLKINPAKLDAHLAKVVGSGFVSASFAEVERATYKKCEEFWQYERADEVPTCLDQDRYLCAQDGQVEWWTTSPVRIKTLGPGKIAATMLLLPEEAPGTERNFELVRENDRWLISKIECDFVPTEAWVPEDFIVYSSKNGVSVNGKKIKFEKLKATVQDILVKEFALIPDEIPVKYEGEVLMGMRGEIQTELAEAVQAAKAARAKK